MKMHRALPGLLIALFGASTAYANVVIEGFESGNLDGYTRENVTSPQVATVSPTDAHDGAEGLGLDGTTWYVRSDAGATLSRGDSFFGYVRLGDRSGRAYLGFGSSTTSTYAVVLGPNTGQFLIQEDDPATGSFNDLAATDATFVAADYYKVLVNWALSGLITAQVFDGVTNALVSTVSTTNLDIASGGIAFRAFSMTGTVPDAFDTITRVAVPEPTTSALFAIAGLAGALALRRRPRVDA